VNIQKVTILKLPFAIVKRRLHGKKGGGLGRADNRCAQLVKGGGGKSSCSWKHRIHQREKKEGTLPRLGE